MSVLSFSWLLIFYSSHLLHKTSVQANKQTNWTSVPFLSACLQLLLAVVEKRNWKAPDAGKLLHLKFDMKSVLFSTNESFEYQYSHMSPDTFPSTSCTEFIYCAERCYLKYDSPNEKSTSLSRVQRQTLADCGSVDWISKWSEGEINSMKKDVWIWSRSSRLNTF